MPSASLSRPTEALDTVERANELRRAVKKWATKAVSYTGCGSGPNLSPPC
jgi:hypothetical protein